MNMKNLTLFSTALFLCFAALPAAAGEAPENWAERFPSKMTPQLEQALSNLATDGTLDLYAVMKDRPSTEELYGLVGKVPLRERHKVLSRELRTYADKSQAEVRDLLERRRGPAAGTAVRILWLANAVRFTGTADDIAAVRDLPDVGYVGVVRDFPVETLHDVAPPNGDTASVPFYDGFESGGFGADWTTATTGSGRIQVTTANGPIGAYHVTMDSSTSGSYGTCTMTLSIDLSSTPNCYLDFMFKEFSDETDPEDAVLISEDGVTYYSVLSLSGGSVYEQKFLDIDQAAASNGISLTSNFRIRFSWRDNYPISTDGFAFDEINVLSGDVPPTPPEPNIVGLQAPDCWNVGVTGSGALILNIDSGVDYTHSDLANQIWANPGEVPYGNNGIDDDGNGYIDDFMGWDFYYNDNDPYPSSYHGTATAGIVCGDGTGGYQTGMAPDAAMAIAMIGDDADAWEAYQYAVLIGAQVITSSYSWKWGIHDPDYHMFRQHSVNELLGGVIHANSIGNQGNQTGSYPIPFNISTPGNCPGPWVHPDQVKGGLASVLGCSGVYLDESLYTDSGQGASAWEDILIYDPGYGHSQDPNFWDYPYGGWGGGQPGLLKPDMCGYTYVRTTDLGGGYLSSFGGTSAATPHLGGAMCLLVSGNLNASPRKISQALQETAEDKGPAGKDLRYGAGKIQAYDALIRLIHNHEFSDTEPGIGDPVQIDVSGVPFAHYGLFWSNSLGSHVIPGVGTLELGSPVHLFQNTTLPASGADVIAASIPNNPALIGQSFYTQGVMDDTSGATGLYLFSLVETLEIQP